VLRPFADPFADSGQGSGYDVACCVLHYLDYSMEGFPQRDRNITAVLTPATQFMFDHRAA
jgi:hypothetical protein